MPFHRLYELRENIFQGHVAYQQGLLWFLANDPQVPGNCSSGYGGSGSIRTSSRKLATGPINSTSAKATAWFRTTS